jgi:hypothetical protein
MKHLNLGLPKSSGFRELFHCVDAISMFGNLAAGQANLKI